MGRGTPPLIAAHRGSSGATPENTIAAFKQAIADGADMIELDVRMTSDFELVVLHDRTVRRTTNAKGRIRNLSLADLRSFDAGSWFGIEFAGERIPLLRNVIDILPSHVQLNIEVKTDGDRRKHQAFADSLVLLLREKNFLSRVLVSSFNHKFLFRLHSIHAPLRTGALYMPVRDTGRKPSTLARRIGATAFICSIAQLRQRHAEDIHANKMTLVCYGVNTRRQLNKAVKWAVDIIITDHPREMREYLD